MITSVCLVFFFFKQKTAYEMRISDWSSDVCSSDLIRNNRGLEPTDLGHCAIRYARLITSDMTHMREEMVGMLRGHGGRLSIGVIMGAVPMLTKDRKSVVEGKSVSYVLISVVAG